MKGRRSGLELAAFLEVASTVLLVYYTTLVTMGLIKSGTVKRLTV